MPWHRSRPDPPSRRRTVLGLAALASSLPAAAPVPDLRSASLRLVTGADGKTAGARLTVSVSDRRGEYLLAEFGSGHVLGPGSVVDLPLQVRGSTKRSRVPGSQLSLRLQASEEDRWDIREARLRITYADGSSDGWRWDDFTMRSSESEPFTVEFRLDRQHRQPP